MWALTEDPMRGCLFYCKNKSHRTPVVAVPLRQFNRLVARAKSP